MTSYDWIEQYVNDIGSPAEGRSLGLTLISGAIAAAVISPVAWLLVRAIDIGFSDAIELLTLPATIDVLFNSVILVVTVTIGSILLGIPLAVLTVQTDLPFRRIWTVILALPLVIPSYIGAFAYVSAFGPRGTLADVLAPLGITALPPIYGVGGTTIVLILYIYPYVFLTTRAALLSFDMKLVEAARTLNHSPWRSFRRVTLPQITPGITAGGLLVALYALSDFGTPAIMHFDVFTRVIFVEYNAFGRDFAALLSLQLLTITVLILAIESRISGKNRGAYVSRGARGRNRITRLGKWTVPALGFCSIIAFFSLVVPLGVLFMWLVRSGPGYADGGFAFEFAFAWNSIRVSAFAGAAAMIAAIPIAYLSARSSSIGSVIFERATYVGYAMPGIVLGLSLVYFGSTFASAVYQTIPLLIFAYVVRFLPQSIGATRSSVLQVDPKLPEAARTLGHSPISAFRRVTLPLIAPGVVAGAALVFLTTMKELPATLLLHPSGFTTLVTYIWRVQDAGYYGQAALPALILVVVSGFSMLILLTQEAKDAEQ